MYTDSAITSTTDPTNSNSLTFYQAQDNSLKQLTAQPNPAQQTNGFFTLESGGIVQGSRITSAYVGGSGGVMVVYQRTRATELNALIVNRNGAVVSNVTLT